MDPDLASKLEAVGIDPAAVADPDTAFARLAERYGPEISIADRYSLEAVHLGIDEAALPVARREELAREIVMRQFPGWEVLGEMRSDPVEIFPYDPDWPHRFAAWRARLTEALGASARRIEHVGSTAIPQLPAKPIVDIQISVDDMTAEDLYVPAIEAAGVPLRARDDLHRYFRPAPGTPREVQIHVCDVGSDWERDHLLFRDYLRVHDAVRDSYADVKRDLADRFRDDRLAYTDAKSAFILGALEDAERWAAASGWALSDP